MADGVFWGEGAFLADGVFWVFLDDGVFLGDGVFWVEGAFLADGVFLGGDGGLTAGVSGCLVFLGGACVSTTVSLLRFILPVARFNCERKFAGLTGVGLGTFLRG